MILDPSPKPAPLLVGEFVTTKEHKEYKDPCFVVKPGQSLQDMEPRSTRRYGEGRKKGKLTTKNAETHSAFLVLSRGDWPPPFLIEVFSHGSHVVQFFVFFVFFAFFCG
jgi:hypothetical protein